MTETDAGRPARRLSGLCRSRRSWWGKERIVVYAHYGAEGWVRAASAVPDVHLVDRETLRPVVEILGSKAPLLDLRADPLSGIALPKRERHRPCLHTWQVEEIATLVKTLEARRRGPVEVEWVYLGDALRLLSVRAGSSLP